MSNSRPTVIWICGVPASGKSVTAWGVFQRLALDGLAVAHVDIDQLGMLYPERANDQGRFRLKDDALAALMPNFADFGIDVVVVSGVVDVELVRRRRAVEGRLTGDVTFCVLSPGEQALRTRLLDRGWDEDEITEVLAEADTLATSQFGQTVLDTSEASVPEVVVEVSALISAVPRAVARREVVARQESQQSARIVVISGHRAVGTSTIGWILASSSWNQNIRTGFADLHQLSFVARPGGAGHVDGALGIANMSALHELFTTRGADRLVVSAHIADGKQLADLRAAMPGTELTLVRLCADGPTLAANIERRAEEASARLADDDLLGADDDQQRLVLEAALQHQGLLEQQDEQDVRIDVSGTSVESIVEEVTRRLVW